MQGGLFMPPYPEIVEDYVEMPRVSVDEYGTILQKRALY